MRKKTQLYKYLVADFIAAAVAWFVFNIVRYYEVAQYEGFQTLAVFLKYRQVVLGQLFVPFFWMILHYFSGYYNKPLEKSRVTELFTTFQTIFVGTVIIFFGILLNTLPDSFHIYYEQFSYLFLLSFVFTYTCRFFITRQASKKIKKREWTISALILGDGKKAAFIRELLEKTTGALGYTVQGSIAPDPDYDLGPVIREKKIEALIVALDTEDDEQLLNLLYSLYQYKLPIKLPLSNTKMLTGGVKIKTITGVPLVDITDNNFPEGEKNIKQALDRIVSLLVLLLLSPVYLYLAIRVRMDSPGPVFLKQERIGYLGKPFMIYKFRTMRQNAEESGPLLSSASDTRITSYGQVMRKYRLDELPQFWNVLKGEMSLVGPRPERKFYIDQIVKQAPYYYLLHNVRPGITSWGMVKYGYASTIEQMIERMQYDILYYENMSLSLDVKILIYTVQTICTGKGI